MRAPLTERQRAIAVAVAFGERPGELAVQLGVSYYTIKSTLGAVHVALGIQRAYQLVPALLRDGYVTLADLLDLLPSAAPLVRTAAPPADLSSEVPPADLSSEVRFEQPTYVSASGLRPSLL